MYFFVVLGYGLALLGMLGIELLGLPKTTCKMQNQQKVGRKLNSETKKSYSMPENRTNSNSTSCVGAANNFLNIPDYFRSNTNKEADKSVSILLTMKIHNTFSNIFSGISCFEGTFKLQVREGSCPYQAPPREVAYALQEPL